MKQINKLSFLILSVLAVLLASCGGSNAGDNPEKSLSDLKDEVMAIHDEVMPKMGDMRKTEKALREKAANLSDSAQILELINIAEDIKAANEGMMNWMRNYEPAFEGTDDEIRTYLNGQKESISRVRDEMNGTLTSGKEILAQ